MWRPSPPSLAGLRLPRAPRGPRLCRRAATRRCPNPSQLRPPWPAPEIRDLERVERGIKIRHREHQIERREPLVNSGVGFRVHVRGESTPQPYDEARSGRPPRRRCDPQTLRTNYSSSRTHPAPLPVQNWGVADKSVRSAADGEAANRSRRAGASRMGKTQARRPASWTPVTARECSARRHAHGCVVAASMWPARRGAARGRYSKSASSRSGRSAS